MPSAGRKNRSNPAWIQRHLNDPYVRAATQAGYRSRAAYKLIEIDDRDRLLRPGARVVELGAAPGSWTQVVRQRLSGRDGTVHGTVIALDLVPFEPLPDVRVIQGDSEPQQFIPHLADYIVAGRFPIEKMITFYDLSDINRAAEDSSSGKAIKPVLRMPVV